MSATLLYDGDCGFCTRSVRWLERYAPAGRAAGGVGLEPWQLADLEALGVDRARVAREVVWVGGDGTRAGGAEAVARYLSVSRRPVWRVVGRAMDLPGVRLIASATYRLIARNRMRLPGSTPACRLPDAERPGRRTG